MKTENKTNRVTGILKKIFLFIMVLKKYPAQLRYKAGFSVHNIVVL